MRLLATRLVIAQTIDALTLAYFWLAIGPGEQTERNPLVVAILFLGGIQLFTLVKIGAAALVGWRMTHPQTTYHWWSRPITSKRFAGLQLLAITAATASGIVGAGFNIAAIIHAQTGFLFNF